MSEPPLTARMSCSFCGKGRHELAVLICNGSASICNECVALCVEILLTDYHKQVAHGQASVKGHAQ